ncbi:hypothetical protein J6590_101036 [Homalodisca vitripennis]|nr:hypothetical protein J6590_101036 [Homalodisca vitripennis]
MKSYRCLAVKDTSMRVLCRGLDFELKPYLELPSFDTTVFQLPFHVKKLSMVPSNFSSLNRCLWMPMHLQLTEQLSVDAKQLQLTEKLSMDINATSVH